MTVADRADVANLARRLADHLAAQGSLTDQRWRKALLDVPRHLFVPRIVWAMPDSGTGSGRVIDIAADPESWWAAVYSDTAIVTQRDDGAGDPAGPAGAPTSSLSAAGVVIEFLELLEPGANDHVLEVGTGTGWTAALLSWLVGPRNVTSVEVDPGVAAQAAANVAAAGYDPHLVIGDGAEGYPDNSPYDRVQATCAIRRVPGAWLRQTRPGGVIVAPWSPGFGNGYKLRLHVADADSATCRFHGPAGYMMLRAQRKAMVWNPHHAGDAARTRTKLDPRRIIEAADGARLAIAALVPDVGYQVIAEESGAWSLLLFELGQPDRSWAACDRKPGDSDFTVTQYGERRLWDQVESAYLRWLGWGRPGLDRFGMTVTSAGEQVWLDEPTSTAGAVR